MLQLQSVPPMHASHHAWSVHAWIALRRGYDRPACLGLCAQFAAVDIDDAASLAAALRGADLVVHTAGPFQRKATCGVLEAAIAEGTPYMDVCDDADYSRRARGYDADARAAGVPAIITAGLGLGFPYPRP